ncbi:type II secretion system protein J [Bdellovibrio bacteriovorus]|uniref:PulJ/GspJ family protein n=1 Tax=Bdellovibrio TaxID=958 RepID=UPI0035A951E3
MSHSHKGFTLIEVLLAMVVLSMVSTASIEFINYVRNENTRQTAIALRNTELSQFFMLLSNPNYVGSLAAYEKNTHLKSCLSDDTILCDTSKPYPLTSFDLTTGNVLNHIDTEATRYVQTHLSFKVHCPLDQSSCEKADYINITIDSSVAGPLGINFSSSKVVTVSPQTTQILTLVPNTQLEDGRPINVILFVDGSNSMSGIKDMFKANMVKLVDSLKDLNANVAVYSINNHNSIQGNYQGYTLDGSGNKTWIETFTELKNLPDGTIFYSDYISKFAYRGVYNTGATYGSSFLYDSVGIFSFKNSMSEAERASTINGLLGKIDRIFESGEITNAKDAPLCAMIRILEEAVKKESALTIDPTSPTVFMLLTNEDDESHLYDLNETTGLFPTAADCGRQFTHKKQKMPSAILVYGSAFRMGVAATIEIEIDGAPATRTFTIGSGSQMPVPIVPTPTMADGDSCLGTVLADPAPFLDLVKINYPTFTGKYNISNCIIATDKYLHLGTYQPTSPATDFCNSTMVKNHVNYKYLIPGTCYEMPESSVGASNLGFTFTEVFLPEDSVAHTNDDLPTGIYNLIKQKFNIDNFYYVPVINPVSGVCPLTPGAQIGTKYQALATKMGEVHSEVVPICSSDYASKFLTVSNYLSTLGVGDFKLPALVAQNISGVEVLRGSNILLPTSGADYTVTNDLLIFKTGYLLPTDIVKVYTK